MTTTPAEEAESPGDTIQVAQPGGNEVEMVDADDEVEEYDFENEPEDEEEEDDGRDTAYYKNKNGAITIDSDDDDDDSQTWKSKSRPWRAPDFLDPIHRPAYERMYADTYENVQRRPLGGDFNTTENAMKQMDSQMTRYLKDYPIEHWLIPFEEAKAAKARLQERERWRSLGIRLFGNSDQQPPALPFQRSGPPQGYQQMPPSQRPYQPRGSTSGTGNLRMPAPYGGGALPAGPHAHLISAYPHQPIMPHQIYPQQIHGHAQHPGSMAPPPPPRLPTAPGQVSVGPQHLMQGSPKDMNVQSPAPAVRPGSSSKRTGGKVKKTWSDEHLPPYEIRQRPDEQYGTNSRLRRNAPEPDMYPWNRDIDFDIERANASWNDDIYDPETLAAMDATRARNAPIIERYDRAEGSKKKQKKQNDDSGSEGEQKRKPRAKKSDGAGKQAGASKSPWDKDYYSFVDEQDRHRASELRATKPEEVMTMWEKKEVTDAQCAEIKICWNPNKGGRTDELEQASFSIKDHCVTRRQVLESTMLTHMAAIRILDFCPNMAWRDTLLRMTSEGGLSNGFIRNRLCWNGNYGDKATTTKRVGSALGQKQTTHVTRTPKTSYSATEKVNGYGPGQTEFWLKNSDDYDHYMSWWGRPIPHRKLLAMKKRPAPADAAEGPARKRSKTGESAASPETIVSSDGPESVVDTEATEEEEEEEEVNDDDAVSVQSDTVLDAIED